MRNKPSVVYAFRHCIVEYHPDELLVITRFHDGTEAHACPHDTDAYRAHAREKSGSDNTMLYCWQHDLAHIIVAEMSGGPSCVLWAVAHNLSTDTADCQREEQDAGNLQRIMQMRVGVPALTGVAQ